MAKAGDLIIKLVVDGKDATVTIDGVDRKLDTMGKSGTKSTESISQGFNKMRMGAIAAAAAIAGILHGLNKAVNAASDFEEENSKLLTVFSKVPGATNVMRKELVDSYNMSTTAATRLLASTGDLLTGLGIQQDKALGLSHTTQKLAADLASFTNAQGGAQAVSEALTKAMLGERESLKTYGIAIGEADVKQQLLADGKAHLTGLALRQAKAEATLTLAMAQSKNAIGDVARTSDSYANIKRKVAAQVEDLAIKFGQILIPIFKDVLIWLSRFMESMRKIIEVFQSFKKETDSAGQSLEDFNTKIEEFNTAQIQREIADLTSEMNALKNKALILGDDYAALGDKFESVTPAMREAVRIQREFAEGLNAADTYISPLAQKIADYEAKIQSLSDKLTAIREKENEEFVNNVDSNINKITDAKRIEININRKANQAQLLDTKKAFEMRLFLARERMRQELKLELQNAQAAINISSQLMSAYQGQSRAMFNIGKGAAIAAAIINTISAGVKALAQYGYPWGLVAMAATFATGYAQVAKIRATEYQDQASGSRTRIKASGYKAGGEFEKGQRGFIEGTGTEIIAPKKTFVQVVKQMASSGDFSGSAGGGSAVNTSIISGLADRMDAMVASISNLKLNANIDAEGVALAVEAGNKQLAAKGW